jgi:hypothetical protein
MPAHDHAVTTSPRHSPRPPSSNGERPSRQAGASSAPPGWSAAPTSRHALRQRHADSRSTLRYDMARANLDRTPRTPSPPTSPA